MAGNRNDREYTKRRDALKRQAKANDLPCWLCHRAIDFTLDWKHPMSFTADHVTPVGAGGSMTGELKPAHRSCNSRRQMKTVGALGSLQAPTTSRDW